MAELVNRRDAENAEVAQRKAMSPAFVQSRRQRDQFVVAA